MVTEFPSALIMIREGIEASLIIAILFAYLRKIDRKDLYKYLWYGIGSSISLSIIIGIGVYLLYGGLSDLQGDLFEGIASLLAVCVLTYMILWMTQNAKTLKEEIEGKIDTSIDTGQVRAIAFIAFITVFREGIETVLFLNVLFIQDLSGTFIGMILGLIIVLFASFLLHRKSVTLPLKDFFKYTSVLLIIFAAGLAGYGTHELIEAAEETGYGLDGGISGWLFSKPYNLNPADKSHPLHEKGALGSVAKGIVGYDGDPEWLRIIVYLSYWIIIVAYLKKIDQLPFVSDRKSN